MAAKEKEEPEYLKKSESVWQHGCGNYVFILLSDGRVACAHCNQIIKMFEWFDKEKLQ